MKQKKFVIFILAALVLIGIGGGLISNNRSTTYKNTNPNPTGIKNGELTENGFSSTYDDPYTFQVGSSHPKYSLEVVNKHDVINVFEEWEIFGKKYVYEGVSTGEPLLYYIDLILAPEPPLGLEPVYGRDAYLKLLQGRFQVYLVVDEDSLNSEDGEEYIAKNLFGAVYTVSNPEANVREIEASVQSALEDLNTENTHFLVKNK